MCLYFIYYFFETLFNKNNIPILSSDSSDDELYNLSD